MNYIPVDIPPRAVDIMNTTRSMGYTAEAAVADIIDNSISAEAKNVNLIYPPGAEYLKIIDDGCGMDFDELINAMRYGIDPTDVRDEKDLGRFGLGLKTASFSQCNILTVISKKNGTVNALRWDPEYIKSHRLGWTALKLDEETIQQYISTTVFSEYDNGTMVVWEDLSLMLAGELDIPRAFSTRMNLIKEHIRLIFHRYLAGRTGDCRKVRILFNNTELKPRDPFQKAHEIATKQMLEIPLDNGQIGKVCIRRYQLPMQDKLTKAELLDLCGFDGTMESTQGFYVYRNCRLLVWATWFRLAAKTSSSRLSRIQVDIPSSMDKLWSLDVRKSTARPPEIIRTNLKSLIGYSQKTSRSVYHGKSKIEIRHGVIHFWDRLTDTDGAIQYQLNEDHPDIKDFEKGLNPEQMKEFKTLIKLFSAMLPVNQLFMDMEDEKTIIDQKDSAQVTDETRTRICRILDAGPDEDLILGLYSTEPFSLYPELLDEEIKKRGLKYVTR